MPRPEGTVARTPRPITIDGRIDEDEWALAEPITNFIQSQPSPGAPATDQTIVRILYDDRFLYISAVCYSDDMDNLVVKTLERDFPGQSTRDVDIFGVTLDTFLDRRNSFLYLINPYGAYRDGQTFNDSRSIDFGWDGAMEVRTQRYEDRWTVEMAIPWSSLRFHPADGEQAWGANFMRRVRRKNEDSYWAPVDRRDPVHRMSKAGTLSGLEGLRLGRNLSVKPYVSADNRGGVAVVGAERGRTSMNAGGDLKYGITPGLTLDLSFRTDFSQVEVDRQQVNLTRFPISFPENRDFFVENSGSFTFGDVTERNYRQGSSLGDFSLFQSRRIGLRDGRPVPILGGGRLTGRAGPFEVGVLSMQTEAAEVVPGLKAPAENFSVLRLRRELFQGSDAGLILLNRTETGGQGTGAHNRSFGVDANFRLLGGMVINSYYAGTVSAAPAQSPEDARDRSAGRLSVAWRDRHWNASAMVRQVGADFDPGIGFVRRRDIRHSYLTLGTLRRPGIPHVYEMEPFFEFNYITDLRSRLMTREATAGLNVDFFDGGTLALRTSRRFDRLIAPFGAIPAGPYEIDEGSVQYQSDAGRPFSASVQLGGGGYYHGQRRSLGLGGDWQASHQLSVDFSIDYNLLDLPSVDDPGATARSTSSVYRARVKYGFSTRHFASALMQYNDLTEQLVTNLRFNLIHAPLSDLFIVYTERRRLNGDAPVLPGEGLLQERIFTVKMTRFIGF
jgi:hypothetical protein